MIRSSYVLIGADIRPRCIDALQNLVGKIKNELVDGEGDLRVGETTAAKKKPAGTSRRASLVIRMLKKRRA